jgi:serine/threonine protein kinase
MDDPTIDVSGAFEATVAANGPAGSLAPPASTLPRSTVLPRLEMVGTEPRLVHNGKLRYETLRRIGAGGFGEVVGARDNDIGRDVAVKRLRPEMRSPAVLARFAEEVRTIGRLEHPNIIPIHDVGVEENGDYYFVMKYVDGVTLESVIEKLAAGDAETHARFGFERRVQIFAALLDAVAFAHSKGILHRDIKPANVMVGAYGEVVLMDWGIAKRLRDPGPTPAMEIAPASTGTEPQGQTGGRGALYQTRVGEVIGTPAYMSPEQSRGEPFDERSEVYSLSLLFYELLTLRHPLADKTTLPEMFHAITHEPVPFAGFQSHPHQPAVGMDLSHFVRKGLAKSPSERYGSVAEMIARLERRAEGDIPIQCPFTLMKQTSNLWSRLVNRHPFLATFVVLAVLGAAIMGGMGLRHL